MSLLCRLGWHDWTRWIDGLITRGGAPDRRAEPPMPTLPQGREERAMNDRTPWAYRALYSRGTAAGLVLMSGAVLAVSQTHVIRDWLAVLHPGWSRPWLWANAAGFELVVLAVGLVLAATGQRSLWVAEVFLIAVSCGAAWDSAPDGTPLVREILGSLMPLQYLAAVLAGHRLYHHHQGSETRAIGAPGDETVAGLLAAELGHATPVDETPGRLLDETLTRLSGQFGLASPGWDDPREWRDTISRQ